LTISRIIFWQPFASPHQEAFLEAVAEQFPGEVILAVEQDMPPERVAQGWRKPVHKLVRVIDVSSPSNHAALTTHRGSDSLHVFTGFFSHPLVWAAFHALKSSQARLAIYSEAPEQAWHTGWLKRLRGRWLAGRYARRFAFVLAVGGVGCEFFETIGFPRRKIIPFGYYLDVPPLSEIEADGPHDDIFRFISAGQLIHRKGIDLLIKACDRLPTNGWQLAIYGDGPERRSLEQLVARLGPSDRITFCGPAANPVVQQAVAAADCAVLPSRFDGWGAFVNESLSHGTPVICSSRCGAAAAVEAVEAGAVFPAADIDKLGDAMRAAVSGSRPTREHREQIHARTKAAISAHTAAGRFCEVMSHA